MTNYNDGKWHGWNGGKCPVDPRSIVQVVGGWELAWETVAHHSAVAWENVIAFRVVKEHKEPREYWLVRDYKNDYFHVTDTEPDYND